MSDYNRELINSLNLLLMQDSDKREKFLNSLTDSEKENILIKLYDALYNNHDIIKLIKRN